MRKAFLCLTKCVRKGFLTQKPREEAALENSRNRGGRTTIHDVAAAAGVSISTASKALNDNGRMSPETRERVKRVASEIGFRPNALARGLLSKRSFTIGLLTNDTYGRFTLPVMAGISEALVDHGVSVFLCAIEDDPALAKVHVDAMLDKSVDGIIASGKRIDRRLPVDLSDLPVPVVYAFTEGTPGSVTFSADDLSGWAPCGRMAGRTWPPTDSAYHRAGKLRVGSRSRPRLTTRRRRRHAGRSTASGRKPGGTRRSRSSVERGGAEAGRNLLRQRSDRPRRRRRIARARRFACPRTCR